MKTLNDFYAEAEKIGGSSYLEGCLACATAYFIFLCMETHYEKVLRCRGGSQLAVGTGMAQGCHRERGTGGQSRQKHWQALSVPLCADRF